MNSAFWALYDIEVAGFVDVSCIVEMRAMASAETVAVGMPSTRRKKVSRVWVVVTWTPLAPIADPVHGPISAFDVLTYWHTILEVVALRPATVLTSVVGASPWLRSFAPVSALAS